MGGVSERAGHEGRREQSLREQRIPSCVVVVKGIPVFRKAALFAGRRQNEDLGRSECMQRFPPRQAGAPMTADVRRTPRRGTPSACATKRMHPTQAREIVACDEGTRPSLGPSTRARQSSLCSAGESLGGEAVEMASRKGKLGSPRRTFTGAVMNGRSAARRVSPLSQGRQRDAMKKRKEIEVSVPARIQELGFGCPHVVVQLQKSVGDVWPRISSANALQKGRQGRVNGGLARSEGRRVKPSAGASGERYSRESASPLETGEDRRKIQGGERSSSSGRHIAKSGAAVAGPGL